MGIKSFYDAVKSKNEEYIEKYRITDDGFKGSTIAIDSEFLYTQYVYGAFKEVVYKSNQVYIDHGPDRGMIFHYWVVYIVGFLRKLEKFGINVIIVLEGKAPEMKISTKEARVADIKKREDKITCIRDVLRTMNPFDPNYQNTVSELNKYLACGRYTVNEKQTLNQILRHMGFKVYQSTTEGEKLCSMLAVYGIANMVYSSDTDNFVYRCPYLVTNIIGYDITMIKCDKVKKILGFIRDGQDYHDQFVEWCIMCGTDFNKNIPKVGSRTALKAIMKYGSIDNFGTVKDISILNHQKVKEIFKVVHPQQICEEELNYKPVKDLGSLSQLLESIGQEGLIEILIGGVKVEPTFVNNMDLDVY